MITLYGLKNCDTCRRAMRDLDAEGTPYRFVDIRSEANLAAQVPLWLESVGAEKLVNARSTTWRGLTDPEKAAAKAGEPDVLIANPALIKRPVVEDGETVSVGWKKG